ncbi:MAG: cupin domain-containing protein [Acetobacteraceae bacterium]|nr:cupin domain-containing protein [Acetobacteraceae bacterium]
MTWKPSAALPKGAEVAVLVGDPAKPGLLIMRLKLPPNYKIPPHTHTNDEIGTVLSGNYTRAMGETFDTNKSDKLPAGSLFSHPANHAHYSWTGDEGAILQLQVTGPWTVTYVNPADDPRK